ncbi:UNC93-like protein 2 [Linum perenne]
MFRALSGLGGGGQVDPTAANKANTALYAAFAAFSFVGGGLYNVLGPRLMLPLGCVTYALYAWSFLYYNHHQNEVVIVAAGGVLGVGGGLLWSVQGAIMTSYPPGSKKGSYISMFWVIFSSGGVVGGLVPFSLNFHAGEADDAVNDATYITFIAFMVAGTLLSIAILPGSQVIRKDGTRCTPTNRAKPTTEAMEVLKLFTNWKMLLLAPAAWASNFFYTYQFNNVNAAQFDTRTRGLNNMSYWGAQMVGSLAIGQVFDHTFKSRRKRGFTGIVTVALIGTAIWGGGFTNQMGYSFSRMPSHKLDMVESGPKFIGPFVLYFCYGLMDAFFQAMIYWVIGAIADDSEILSRYVGFYKGVQSLGATVAWQLDSSKVPMMAQLIVNWGLATQKKIPILPLTMSSEIEQDPDVDGRQVSPPLSAAVTTAAEPAKSRWRHNSPLTQVIIIGLVSFCCPGMFRAFSGLGGGGQVDPTAANKANTATYAAFAAISFAGGGLYNVMGPRVMLPLGCVTYVLYVGSFLYYNHYKNEAVIIVAGAVLGIGGGLLWSVQGAIMTSYPPASKKGSYISMFWVIFSSGGVIGGLVPFSLNFHVGEADVAVSDSTYIAFIAFMVAGTLISIAILPGSQVIRKDGTQCTPTNCSKITTEAIEVLKLFTNWKMLLLAPAAWASNFYYTYQFNNVNAAQFDTRTRGLNNVSYWGAQIVGSLAIGLVFDHTFKSRRKRGFAGIATVALIGTAIWGGGFANQMGYSFSRMPNPKLDMLKSGSKFIGPFVLFFCFGLLDAFFQAMIYWAIGAMADDSEVLSRYVGFYKGVQNTGAAVAWQLDSSKVPMMVQLIVNWGLATVSYPMLVALVALAVIDDVDDGNESAP